MRHEDRRPFGKFERRPGGGWEEPGASPGPAVTRTVHMITEAADAARRRPWPRAGGSSGVTCERPSC